MPPLSQSGLKSDLAAIFKKIESEVSANDKAKLWAKAIKTFVVGGMPMTINMLMPGSCSGGTAPMVMGMSIMGGIDKPAYGMGLDLAAKILESKLGDIYGKVKDEVSADDKADQISTAIFKYFSEAKVMTTDKNVGPHVCAAPGAPVVGMMKGKGGVDGKPSEGKGYDSAKSKLESDLTDIFKFVKEKKEASDKGKEIAAAIHAFCKEGKVEVMGISMAGIGGPPASPPAPPPAAFVPGPPWMSLPGTVK